MDKGGVAHIAMEKEISSFAATWMDLEGIMPSEINQTVKDNYYVILFKCRI